MPGLYIGSTQPKAGKTLCVCSMGVLLQKRGCKIGYMKPVGHNLKIVEAGSGDADALVVQEVLGLDAAPDVLTPVLRPDSWSTLSLTPRRQELAGSLELVRKSYAAVGKGKDLTLVSGSGMFPSAGQFAGVNGPTLVNELDLKVLLIESCDDSINFDAILFAKHLLGDRLLGVILNKLNEKNIPLAFKWMAPYLESYGVSVLGMIPYERELNVIRSMNLAYELGGRIVAGNSSASSTGITGFLIGAMQVDSFMMHLRAKSACAVVVGGDRTDLQLAALCQKGHCLVLTGNIGPHELVRSRAEKQGVPIIVVKEDTYVVARRIARVLEGQKFSDLEQINRGIRLFDSSIDLDLLLAAINCG